MRCRWSWGGLDRGAIRARVGELVDLVGLRGRESKFPSQLSGGQQQRVGVARALAANPAVLLCDEPTSALDPATMNQILDLLVDVNRELGVTIVLITHELAAVRRICTHAALLDYGRIVESGPVAGLVTDPGSQLGTLISPLPDGVFDRPAAALVTATGEVTGQPWLATIMAATGFAPSIVGGGVEVIGGTTVGRIVVEFAPDADRAIIDAEVARHPDVELTWLDSVGRGSPPAGVADAGADALAVAADAGAVAR